MTNIYLIRHGETDWNNKNILMGQKDIPLNVRGISQAKSLSEYLKNFSFDNIFSSDLSRAKSTAEAIVKENNMEIIFDKRLRECSAGNLEGLTYDKMLEIFPEEIKSYSIDPMNYLPPDGENRKEFIGRVVSFVYEILENFEGKELAFVTHGGVIRALLSHIISDDFKLESPQFAHLFRVDNCSLSLLKYKDKKWEISYLNYTEEGNRQ